MTHLKNIPDKATSAFNAFVTKYLRLMPDSGFFVLLGIMVFLAFFASFDFSQKTHVLTIGEIASSDVVADRLFQFEDKRATKNKREQTRQMQPLVCDLVLSPIDTLRNQFQNLFIALNQATSPEEKEIVRQQLSRNTGIDLTPEAIATLTEIETQEQITSSLLPFIQQHLTEGVLLEMRPVLPYRGGVIIRDILTREESYYPEASSIPDIKSLEASLSQRLKETSLSSQKKRILTNLLIAFTEPTLIPNYEATSERAEHAEQLVAPVIQRIDKGEALIRQGERVSPEQQAKLFGLLAGKEKRFNAQLFFGTVICGFLLSTGLLFSPSGKPTSSMEHRDFIFIAALVGTFSLIARGFHFLGVQIGLSVPSFSPEILAFAVPIAGASAIAAMVFSTRRYLVTGLLLAFFCTLMSEGGVGLFLFYFLSAMWSTWLTSKTQNRQDIVWSLLPSTAGLFALWLGASLYGGTDIYCLLPQAIAVLASAFFSLILTFALAPIVEMAFGYTTRFRLMELLNLEQPLLRDLMLNAPGTYHHALIVSNMVEAAAETIGAHSLLCKVAALYHDIGKTPKANYYIENQFSEANPHNRLTPSMSALILISHVKLGVERAEKHKLGREVIAIIGQHHGSSLIRYFYQKALQQVDATPPTIEDFSYPGPAPQTREAALVMLADAVEASSRTLLDPTPTKLLQHITTIVKGIYSSGQLDECDLTFRDLDMVTQSFHRILRGIFHHRIVYPDKLTNTKPVVDTTIAITATDATALSNAQQ